MAHVMTFRTSRFDITKETPNPINPIAGESLLRWLREKLMKVGYEVDAPGTEDWGWYMGVERAGAIYLVGASAETDQPGPPIDWALQIHKQRSFKDKITGGNKMTGDDPLSREIENILRAESDIGALEVDRSS